MRSDLFEANVWSKTPRIKHCRCVWASDDRHAVLLGHKWLQVSFKSSLNYISDWSVWNFIWQLSPRRGFAQCGHCVIKCWEVVFRNAFILLVHKMQMLDGFNYTQIISISLIIYLGSLSEMSYSENVVFHILNRRKCLSYIKLIS